MDQQKTSQKWTDSQLKYAAFVARGNRNLQGEKRTEGQFADAVGVDRRTLWRWRQLPGFKYLVLDLIIAENLHDMTDLLAAQRAKARGQKIFGTDSKGRKYELKPDVPAFNAITKLFGLTQDKLDLTTGGNPMPAPILELPTYKPDSDPEPDSD